MTETQERVLRAFLEDPTAPRYGYDLMRAARVQSGTLYPMLARWADEGLVESQWESLPEAERAGRPPRKFYRLTGEGIRVVRLELATAHDRRRDSTESRRTGRALRPAGGH